MKVALIPLEVVEEREANLAAILRWTRAAARANADLAVFPEAALTGLVHRGRPETDLALGEPIPGPATDAVADAARRHGIHVALGLLERDRARLYDAAVLLDPRGEIVHTYRRVHPGWWHAKDADPDVYGLGTSIDRVDTDLGSIAFLICGDLFDDGIVARACALEADCVLFPFWRCFDDGSRDDARWLREEQPVYVERARRLAATVLMVNALASNELAGGAFGGALVVGQDGRVQARRRLGCPEMLLGDLPTG